MSSPTRASHKLVDILRALPRGELDSLVSRLGIRIDAAKRIDPPAQVARALVGLPELRDTVRLHPASVELLHRVAESGGHIEVPNVPPAFEPLLARGLMFARAVDKAFELILPAAYLIQLKPWEGEDPRGIRALLAQASLETLSAIAAHYLGRPATSPVVLSLETAWDVISSANGLQHEIDKLALNERRVLEGIDQVGGEVDTEELLELEREPLRLRTASGATASRRGVGFSLERRGLLIPVHPNRHIIPTEVSRLIGATHHAERAARRKQIREFITTGDHAPHRARFSADASAFALGLALAAREGGTNDVRAAIGTPKSLVQRLAARFGRDVQQTALIIALSRAIGLWDPSATNASAPPGSLPVGALSQHLFVAWQRGGAWDEARIDPEVLRVAGESRDASPAGVLRELTLEALTDLGENNWIPWTSLGRYIASDERMPGIGRLLRRWAERASVPAIEPLEVLQKIVLESLPALGIVDIGAMADQDPDANIALRLTPRGRSLLAGHLPSPSDESAHFLDTHILRVGPETRVGATLALAPFVEVARAAETLDLLVAPQTLARALSAGVEADVLRSRMEAVAELPETLSRTLAQASLVVGRGTFVGSAGFLWVEDANVRELLRTRRATADLFVDPSPPAGLLLQPGVDLEKVVRRCRALGVEVISEGAVVRTRTLSPLRVTPPRGTER